MGVENELHIIQGEGHEPWLLGSTPDIFREFVVEKSSDFLHRIFLKPPTPSISGVINVCRNEIVTYSVANDNSASRFCWDIQNGEVVSSNYNGSQVEIQWTLEGNGGATVTEINQYGASSDAYILGVNIFPQPTANAGEDLEICPNESTTLLATGGTVYSWSPTTGLNNPTLANPIATIGVTTTYTVSVSNNYCVDSDDVTVIVENHPSCGNPVNCTAPTGQFADDIGASQATVFWDAVPGAIKYKIEFREVGGTNWTSKATTNTFKKLKPLAAATTYEYKIKSRCPAGWTDYSTLDFFTTESCDKPGNIIVGGITSIQATISWNASVDAIKYKIRHRKVGAANWIKNNTPVTSIDLTDLTSSTDYEYQLKSRCPYGWTGWTDLSGFTTSSSRMVKEDVVEKMEVHIFPNPTQGHFYMDISGAEVESIVVKIFDYTGHLILERQPGEMTTQSHFDLSAQPKGIYFVQVVENRQTVTKRVIVQ
jgi:hypothetical protein